MSQPGILYEIRWKDVCPWLILVAALRVSLLFRVILLAFAGMLLTRGGWRFYESLFDDNRLAEVLFETPELSPRLTWSDGAPVLAEVAQWPLVQPWLWLSEPFWNFARLEVTAADALRFLVAGIWALLIWSIFGGAICRIAGIELTRGKTVGTFSALNDALLKVGSTVGGPIISLLGAASLASPAIVGGLLLHSEPLTALVGFLWIFLLAWSLMVAVVLIGLLIGWPLMWATIAVERTDSFDAVSRCYAYVYQRPLQLAFYLLVAVAMGLFGEVVVYVFLQATLYLSEWLISWGAGLERTLEVATRDADSPGSSAIQFWKTTAALLAACYPFAYFWSAIVAIYLLLRRHVDSTDIEEAALPEADDQSSLSEVLHDMAQEPNGDAPPPPASES